MALKDIFNSFKKSIGYVVSKKQLQDDDVLSPRDKRLLEKYKEQMQELQRLAVPTNSGIVGGFATTGSDSSFDSDVYFYDFFQEYNNNSGSAILVNSTSGLPSNSGTDAQGSTRHTLILPDSLKVEKERVYKPIDVFNELTRVPNPAILENLEDKILVLKSKEKLIRYNAYAKREVIDMTLRLENRRKYSEFEDFFGQFENTTLELVEALVNKYGFVMKTSDLFIPKFPEDAIKIMEEYNTKTKELCGKLPVYYVIAERSLFQKEYRRNDPILLVQSPFGMYFQILGAWDKELVLLEEL